MLPRPTSSRTTYRLTLWPATTDASDSAVVVITCTVWSSTGDSWLDSPDSITSPKEREYRRVYVGDTTSHVFSSLDDVNQRHDPALAFDLDPKLPRNGLTLEGTEAFEPIEDLFRVRQAAAVIGSPELAGEGHDAVEGGVEAVVGTKRPESPHIEPWISVEELEDVQRRLGPACV